MAYFPMFIELKNKQCLVVGGGQVAFRKVKALRDFGAKVCVIAPNILPEIWEWKEVVCLEKYFEQTDITNQTLVIAATDDLNLNHRISECCKEKNIPVNAVDQIEDCSFIFPAYLKEGEVVAAFSSGGQSPVTAQYLKQQTRSVLTPNLGELAACLGTLRNWLQQCTNTETERKQIYQELLQLGLEQEAVPSKEEIARVIQKYQT